MNVGDADHQHDLTDDRLDALLAAADSELLRRIQAEVDPRDTLLAVMSDTAAEAPELPPGRPERGASKPPDRTAGLIARRFNVRRLARDVEHAHTLASGLDRRRDLDHRRDLDPALFVHDTLARSLNSAHFAELARVFDSAPSRAVFDMLARAHDRALFLRRVLERDLDLDSALDLLGEVARTLDLALDVDLARDRARVLIDEVARTLDLDRTLILNLARAVSAGEVIDNVVHGLVRDLNDARSRLRELAAADAEIDASGADLSHLEIDDLDLVAGVVWTAETVWPPGLRSRILARSKEIRAGVWQVGNGTERRTSVFTSQ